MLESSVDRFGGPVGGAGVIEVGQDVGAPLGQGPCQGRNLLQPVEDGRPQGTDELLHQVLSQVGVLRRRRHESGAG